MANRTVKSQSKKAMSTKYSAIGSTVVPLSQQMRNRPSSTSNKNQTTPTDNFFDDIMADWDQPDTNPKNKNFGLGIHNKNNDVDSSSSLAFTPTPPISKKTNTNTTDRNIYILNDKENGHQIPENKNNTYSHILDTTNTDKIIETVIDTIRNDPNYLPPPEHIDLSSNTDSNHSDSDSDKSNDINPKQKQNQTEKQLSLKPMENSNDTIPPSPGHSSELNPWAHLNKTINTNNIMEAPIEDIDDDNDNGSFEDRGFLKHEADDHNDVDTPYANDIVNHKNNNNNIQMTKCCYCLIFIIGIVIGILLTIALIRHQAIDANYLFGPTDVESENDSVIKEEINSYFNNSNSMDTINTKQPTQFNVWNPFRNRTWKHKTRMPTYKPTNKPSKHPTNKPTYKPTLIPTISPIINTDKPTDNPSHNPTYNPSMRIITSSPTHSPVINIIDMNTDNNNVALENDSNKDNDVNIDNDIELGNDTNRQNDELNGLIQLSDTKVENDTNKQVNIKIDSSDIKVDNDMNKQDDININIDNDKESENDINGQNDELNGLIQLSDLNDEKTTPSPTDYHHVHQGIQIAEQQLNNKINSNNSLDQNENVIDNNSENNDENNDNIDHNQEEENKKEEKKIEQDNIEKENDNNDNTESNIENKEKNDNVDISADANTDTNVDINKKETDNETNNDENTMTKSTPHSIDNIMNDTKPLCNVIPNSKCPTANINRLPLPFDKPLSAQLSCHKNTCLSPLHLPGQSIISGETYEADRTVIDIEYDIPIKCHLTELNTIHVTRNGYNNNEDWKYCIRISNDNSLLSFPILHITFSLISFDIEQGFDNLFMTTQFNSIYDDYTESWTGNWSTLHRFEPNTWYQNYWMTSSAPNTFIELCLRLQSDESITGKGFISKFSITKEIGYWSEWSICTAHSNTPKIANGACGIGVHRHESYCPKYIVQSMDNTDRFDWNNGTHSCIHKYSNYPLNKYCIVANCNDIDNDKYAPINIIKSLKQKGEWDNNYAKYIYNGRSRIDPQYPDPFNIIMNTNKYKINLNELKNNLQLEIDNILSRYPIISQQLFPKTFNMLDTHFEKMGVRLLSSLLLGRIFTYVTTGSSNTAGHDNVFMSSYPMQLNSLMQVIWNKYSIYGGGFRVRNQAVGGHLGTQKQGPCISALIGTYDKNIDMVSWESFMNDGTHIDPIFEEIWLRNILLTYNRTHSQPFLTCISTSESGQAGCRIDGGRYIFNSFLGYYANATGVSNYYGQYVCNTKLLCNNTKLLDKNGNDIACVNRDGNEACSAGHVSWHPSPHRHRVMAETFAVAFMQSVLNTIDRLFDNIENIIYKNHHYPSYELACLLEDYINDKNHAVFERPITTPIKCGIDFPICENAMWCATSFWPAPKHNQLHRYFINKYGFYNNDTIDLPVDPLIMRNGGRAPIDHKAQWIAENKIGYFLEIKVKVPTRYIMIVYPQGSGRWNLGQLFSPFKFLVNGIEKYCQGPSYDKNIQQFCLLDCQKYGKYILKLIIVNDTNPFIDPNPKVYAIDEIAGI